MNPVRPTRSTRATTGRPTRPASSCGNGPPTPRKEERWFIRYNGGFTAPLQHQPGVRTPKLFLDDEQGFLHELRPEDPPVLDTDDVLAQVADWLRANVLEPLQVSPRKPDPEDDDADTGPDA